MAERDPCPGCGRLSARRGASEARYRHRCPHGLWCVAFLRVGVAWQPGDDRHAAACIYCADKARRTI